MKKNYGFTLAEVLITIGVIGVIAAITLPTIIQKYKKAEATARLKKFYSTMSQAIMFAENDRGIPAKEWIDPNETYDERQENPQLEHDLNYAYWNEFLAPYIKTLKVENGDADAATYTTVYFEDGSKVSLHMGNAIDLRFDINGDKFPNEYGKDIFLFFIITGKNITNTSYAEVEANKSFSAPYISSKYNTREKALKGCIDTPMHCSALLQYDNWEFKSDYPYKL